MTITNTPALTELPPRARLGYVLTYECTADESPAALVGHLARLRAVGDHDPVALQHIAAEVRAARTATSDAPTASDTENGGDSGCA